MDAISHNLLESYFHDGNDAYHYNTLQSGDNYFRVDFTREISAAGIVININQIKPVNRSEEHTSELQSH